MKPQREDIHPAQNTCPYFRLRAPDRCPNRKCHQLWGVVTPVRRAATRLHDGVWR